MNKTYIPAVYARQRLAALVCVLSLADFVANNGVIDIPMPNGSQVVGGDIAIGDAFNAGTTDTIAIGTPDSAARYLAATDGTAVARTAVTPTGYKHVSSTSAATQPVRVTRAATGTAGTKGTVTVTLQYVELDKADWTEGNFTPAG